MQIDILQEVTKPAEAVEGFDAILYGDPKVGKTSTLDDPVLKVLLIDLEGGTAVLSEAENVSRLDVPEIARKQTEAARKIKKDAPEVLQYEVLLEIGKAIDRGELNHYDMIAIDSLTQIEAITKEYVALKYAPNRRREIQTKFGAQSDWGDLRDLITRMVKWFHGFTKRGDKSVHLLWIAHVADKKEPIPGTDEQKVVGKKIALQGGNTAEIVTSIVDGQFYMYNRDVNKGTKESPDIQIERMILTKTSGMYPSAARQSKKRDPLPAVIKDPVWSEIIETLGYKRKAVVSAE